MNCPNCHQALSHEAQFCSRCGQSVRAPMHTTSQPFMPPASAAPARKSNATKWLGALVGVFLLAALAFIIGKSGLLSASGKEPNGPSVLQAESPMPEGPNLLQAQAPLPEGPSLLQAEGSPAVSPEPPPQDILNWLEHLKRIERARQAMRNDFTPAMDMLKNALSLKSEIEEDQHEEKKQNIGAGYEAYAQNWYKLQRDFESVPPPPSCKVLADTYHVALQNYIVLMVKIQESMAKEDIGGLMNMRGSAQGNVDQQLIQSDVELTKLCRQYRIPKDFSIESDTDTKSLLGLGF